MADSVNITVNTLPVIVDVTEAASTPVAVALQQTSQPVAVDVEESSVAVAVAVTPPASSPVQVIVTEAPPGEPGEPGEPGAPGAAGQNAQIQVLTLAAYLALSPAQQMNGTWYVIPKT